MKVVNIIEEGRIGGPLVRICQVTPRLAAHGVATVVLHPTERSERFVELLERNGIAHVAIPLQTLSRNMRLFGRYLWRFPADIRAICRVLARERPELVHVSGGVWQFKGVLAAALVGVKVVWHLNDTSLPLALRWLFPLVAFLGADGFIVAGERVRRYYLRYPFLARRPVFLVPAPVDSASFDPERVVGDPAWPKGVVTTITVGNFVPLKGIEHLLRVAAELKRRGLTLRMRVLGYVIDTKEAYFVSLERLRTELGVDFVEFHDGVQDVRGFLKAADIYLCTSRAEASPMAVWEAMSMGLPVVSTDVGDVSRHVRPGESGFILPVDDVRGMADAVATLAVDAGMRRTLGREARRVAVRELDIEVAVSGHLRAYRHLTGERSPT
ncbi:MAG: glycosyltransferase family 4 protein [Magnetococcales bacterium]|nr:glycosyltransferase family 4 protein [Magnetococcales bacterium]